MAGEAKSLIIDVNSSLFLLMKYVLRYVLEELNMLQKLSYAVWVSQV